MKTKNKILIAKIISFFLKPFYKKKGIHKRNGIKWSLDLNEGIDLSIFFDAGNIWGVDYNSTLADENKIRSSVGIAIDLFTPIGPLNFSLSEPITKSKNDITESFRFNLGTTF